MNTKDSINPIMSVEVSQRVDFSCSYVVRLPYLDIVKYVLNSCYYRFEATVCADSSFKGCERIISFEDLKSLMEKCVPDQCFLYDSDDINQLLLCRDFKNCQIPTKEMQSEISAEGLLNEISLLLIEELKKYPGRYLKETKLRENNNSYVSWTQEVK